MIGIVRLIRIGVLRRIRARREVARSAVTFRVRLSVVLSIWVSISASSFNAASISAASFYAASISAVLSDLTLIVVDFVSFRILVDAGFVVH